MAKREVVTGLCIHGKRRFFRWEVDWPNRFKIRSLPFQKGDLVITPKGEGRVSAVGRSGLHSNLYRVGHSYWYAFQLKRAGKGEAN